MRAVGNICSLVLLAVVLCGADTFAASNLSVQRNQYVSARDAFAKGQIEEFRRLSEKLRTYPLYPYLRYQDLSRRVDHAAESEIRQFLDQYGYLPVAYSLRGAWLQSLKKRGLSKKFLQYYDDRKDTRLACYALRARMLHGPVDRLEQDALALWMVGHSQPTECDPIFAWLNDRGLLTKEARWQRIELAIEKRNFRLAGYLAKKLPALDQGYIQIWEKIDRDPMQFTDLPGLQEDSIIVRKIASHAVARLARRSVDQSLSFWHELQQGYQFSDQERQNVDAKIALVAAYRHHPLASDLMQSLPENIEDNEVQQWRARAAMRSEDWAAVLRSIVLMSEESRAELEWRYWHARALDKLGIENDARGIFQELAQERDYYGFLAADRMSSPYQMNHQVLSYVDTHIGELLQSPEFVRIRELYHVGQLYDAQREWNRLPGILDDEQLAVAAYIAHQWGWHFNAIITIAKTGNYDDLSLRFPTPYDSIVNQASKRFAIDSEWIYGIIRQESAFRVNARSHAGASGLMQLMPATAKQVARSIKEATPSGSKLLQPEFNVALGSAYLQQMMERYDHHQVLATASYNAGPHRVKSWLPSRSEAMDADIWVDTIPFDETRKYVRRVMSYTAVYEWKSSNTVTRLQQRMPAIDLH